MALVKSVQVDRLGAAAGVPRVSVCIPTYRGAATLDAAIASVRAQTEHDLELLVVDDNSPDDTAAVVARHAAADPRVRYLRNACNLGPQGNWNRCLEEARGRYFKLLPHDDVLAPSCLARQVAVFQDDAAQQLALAFSAREVIGADGRVLTRRGLPGGRTGRVDATALMRACLRHGTNLIGEPGAVLMRLELARRVGPFDATHPYVIDLDYWFRLLAHGHAHYDEEALTGFRVSRSQWSVVIGSDQAKDFRRWSRIGAQGLRLGPLDRMAARVMPALNNVARLAFYRLYLQ